MTDVVTKDIATRVEESLSDGRTALVSGVIGLVGLGVTAATHDWVEGLAGGVALVGLMLAVMSGIAYGLRRPKAV